MMFGKEVAVMTKFSYSNNPWFQLLSREQVEAIHLSSLKILEEIGVMIQNETALKLLTDAGADVDPKTKTARIPQHLAKESLVKAPSTIRLYSREAHNDRR